MRIIIKNLPPNTTIDDLSQFYTKYGEISDIYIPKKKNKNRSFGFVGFKKVNDINLLMKTDKMYFKNKKISVSPVYDDKVETAVGDSNILFMANIPDDTTEQQIRDHFENYEYKTINDEFEQSKKIKNDKTLNKNVLNNNENILNDQNKNDQKVNFKIKDIFIHGNTAKVEFYEKCVSKIIRDNKTFLGRRVYLAIYKGNSQMYYNGLFFNFESIVNRVCEQTKVPKEQLLDLKDKNLGTRIALLESHLVEETKRFLLLNNINLDNITHKRFKNKLIVRNFNLLKEIPKAKVKIAPSKCLAILEFDDDESASNFYKKIHLKRVGNKPIFCEYLPITKPNKEIKFTEKLVIKNIPFQATLQDIKNLFSSKYKVKIRLPKKNSEQHRGFCFLFAKNQDEAKDIFYYFGSSTHLFGRRLVIEPAEN
ncbi:Multiple RNA-binding domain-containing protein 1 [Dictyocoela muelleri]|nr:Multiple RNA-binding domain-containing protein 1 [Dictyocoela muelleri]